MYSWNLIKLYDFAKDEKQVMQFLKDKNILECILECSVFKDLISSDQIEYSSLVLNFRY